MPTETRTLKQEKNSSESKLRIFETKPKSTKTMKVMLVGGTGTGKTTFINKASGGSLSVGKGLQSCTHDVAETLPFLLDDDREVILVDTPGLDDTTRSDNEILSVIADYLTNIYSDKTVLSGILYLHRINDVRMSGSSTRNLKMFMKLCGDKQLRNVFIVTTRWAEVDSTLAESREKQLRELFFKPVLAQGAMLTRHNNTRDEARRILRQLLDEARKSPPLPLRIQMEMVDSRKPFMATDVGRELLGEELDKYNRELNQLDKDLADVVQDQDSVAIEELSNERDRIIEKLAEISQASDIENLAKSLQVPVSEEQESSLKPRHKLKLGQPWKSMVGKFHKPTKGDRGAANLSSKSSKQISLGLNRTESTRDDGKQCLDTLQTSFVDVSTAFDPSSSGPHTSGTAHPSTPNTVMGQSGQAYPTGQPTFPHSASNTVTSAPSHSQKTSKLPGSPLERSGDNGRRSNLQPAPHSNREVSTYGDQANSKLNSSSNVAARNGEQSKAVALTQGGSHLQYTSAHSAAHNTSASSTSSTAIRKVQDCSVGVGGSTSNVKTHEEQEVKTKTGSQRSSEVVGIGPCQALVTAPTLSIGAPSSVHATSAPTNQLSKHNQTGSHLEEEQAVEGRHQHGLVTQPSGLRESTPPLVPVGDRLRTYPLRSTPKGKADEGGELQELQQPKQPQSLPHDDRASNSYHRPSSPTSGDKVGSQPPKKSQANDIVSGKAMPHVHPPPFAQDHKQYFLQGHATDASRGPPNTAQGQREAPVRAGGPYLSSSKPGADTTEEVYHEETPLQHENRRQSSSPVPFPATETPHDTTQSSQTNSTLNLNAGSGEGLHNSLSSFNPSPTSTIRERGKQTHEESGGPSMELFESDHFPSKDHSDSPLGSSLRGDNLDVDSTIERSFEAMSDTNAKGFNESGSNVTSQATTPGFYTPQDNEATPTATPATQLSVCSLAGSESYSQVQLDRGAVQSSENSTVAHSAPSSGDVAPKDAHSDTLGVQVTDHAIAAPHTVSNPRLTGSTEENTRPADDRAPNHHRPPVNQMAADVPSGQERESTSLVDMEGDDRSNTSTLVSDEPPPARSDVAMKDDLKPTISDASPPDTKSETGNSSTSKKSWVGSWFYGGSATTQTPPESVSKTSSRSQAKTSEAPRPQSEPDISAPRGSPLTGNVTTGISHNRNPSRAQVERASSDPELSSRRAEANANASRKLPSGAFSKGEILEPIVSASSIQVYPPNTVQKDNVQPANDGSVVEAADDEKSAIPRALSILQSFLSKNFVGVSSDLKRGAIPKDKDLDDAILIRDDLLSIVDALEVQISRPQKSTRIPGSFNDK
ncbi:hypothetical protein E1B28_011836 [Marasmius oreades]|uniref:G domain-containing protein n=1 Tax=Marasmius oreades TaxID=181124 RepID=A0A9P7RUX4_9AGAR|nr:uncharacterized protein E1B28_011836 [Marasmius oreades]KAG7090236.1 hypothetical protein E1B28_011836 [Marasmius oreades]